MANTRCPTSGDCTPPSLNLPVFQNPEFCAETMSDRCVIHTGLPLSIIGANTGIRLDVILKNIDQLISANQNALVPGFYFGTVNPPVNFGIVSDSYMNTVENTFWNRQLVLGVPTWVLKYSPTPLGPFVANRVLFAGSSTTIADDEGLTFDSSANQLKLNTTVVNSNYKFLIGGGMSVVSGILNMDEYASVFNMSAGRVMIYGDGVGMKFRLFNNDDTNFPDTSKSFSFYNKGFEHMRLYSDATSFNGLGQPLTWEFRTRLNYRLYLTNTANSTGAHKILTRNIATNEVELIDPVAATTPTIQSVLTAGSTLSSYQVLKTGNNGFSILGGDPNFVTESAEVQYSGTSVLLNYYGGTTRPGVNVNGGIFFDRFEMNVAGAGINSNFQIKKEGFIMLSSRTTASYADNAAAIAAGLPVGTIYRSGDFIKIVRP